MVRLSELAATQPRVCSVLSAALESGRMHHAYLLVCAELRPALQVMSAMAQALVCERRSGLDGCDDCPACRRLAAGSHPDVVSLSPNDKGIINVEQVREASSRLGLKAADGRVRVVRVERADVMPPPAQNALLKTLEEPPGPTCFLLTTTRLRSLLPTVRSRCLTLRLAPFDRLAAWSPLAESGVTPELARVLGPIVGADQDRAAELVEQGAAEIVGTVSRCFDPELSTVELLAIAADLGQSRERADLAISVLEVAVRDALARLGGAAEEQLYAPAQSLVPSSPRALAAVVSRLQELRRLSALHINRTLALEGLLFTLSGRLEAQQRGAQA
jgi:DNA polymerase III subunit delta'